MFDQDSSPLSWLRTHIKLKIRLTPSAAENCRTQNGIRHIDANRQNYALSRSRRIVDALTDFGLQLPQPGAWARTMDDAAQKA
jgi:hypothetical protein